MEKLFLPYELAAIAKERGFDEPCLACFTSTLTDDNFNQFWFSDIIWGNSDFHPNPRICKNSDFGHIKSCTAPTYQQIIDWFREKYKIHISIRFHSEKEYEYIIDDEREHGFLRGTSGINKTYYEALNKAIEEALKLI